MGSAASTLESSRPSTAKPVPSDMANWNELPQLFSEEGSAGDESKNFRSWDFNIWHLDDEFLLPLTMHIAADLGFQKTFSFDTSIWCNFIWEVQRLMSHTINPYHTYRHAIDVAQTCACMVKGFSASIWLSDLDMFALYVSAIVHDLEHPGLNNVYQVNAGTPLAIRYNDISVLENHHCAKAFEVFSLPKCNIINNFTLEQKKYMRKTIISLVLITDMTHHFNLRGDLDAVIAKHMQDSSASKLDEKDTLIVLKSIIHTADISNPAKPWEISKKWSDLVIQEFFEQGDREKLESLPVSMNCDRDTTHQDELSMNFTDFIVAPFFFSMAKLLPKMLGVCKILESNRNEWHKLYIARATASIADEAARTEALGKWEARRAGFAEKITDLEKSVEAIWAAVPAAIEETACAEVKS